MITITKLKDLFNIYNFHPKKSLGQNFLFDHNILKKTADFANISNKDIVVEIGSGAGQLTMYLAEKGAKVYAVEYDNNLIPVLTDVCEDYDNVVIINKDFLRIDFNSLCENNQKLILIGNVPYYVTTPIIEKILSSAPLIKHALLLVQKEYAERIFAKPATKCYSSLTCFVNLYSKPRLLMHTVTKNVFYPRPKIDSSLIKLDILDSLRVRVSNEKLLLDVIHASFGKRRKTIKNALLNYSYSGKKCNYEADKILKLLSDCGINEKRRGETLTLQDFADISNSMASHE